MRRALQISSVIIVAFLTTAAGKSKEEKLEKVSKKDSTSEKHSSSSKYERTSKSSKSAPEPSGPPSRSEGYEGYKYVRGRNIFDPSRRGMKLDSPESSAAAAASVPRGRTLALTGTMVTEGKALAFFGGSAAEGNRVIAAGNNVAGYKVASIAQSQVVLEREGKTLVLDIGRQVSFENPSGDGVNVTPVIETAVAPPTPQSSGVPVVPGMSADREDVLRRMMERRAKEVGK